MTSLDRLGFALWVIVPVLLLIAAEVAKVLDEAAGRGELDSAPGEGFASASATPPSPSS